MSSFFHELLAEIAEIGQFSYNLRTMPSGTKHGGAVGESTPEGLIDEVYNNVRIEWGCMGDSVVSLRRSGGKKKMRFLCKRVAFERACAVNRMAKLLLVPSRLV